MNPKLLVLISRKKIHEFSGLIKMPQPAPSTRGKLWQNIKILADLRIIKKAGLFSKQPGFFINAIKNII
jgi:hypothetical protein